MTTKHTCGKCGESFDSQKAINAHKASHSYEYQDPDTLRELYHDKGLSTPEIAEKYGVHSSTIRRAMKRNGIDRRMSCKDPRRPPSHYLASNGDGVGNAYEKISTVIDGEDFVVMVHRLIAYAYEKLSARELFDSEVVVHHESGHGLDNRPGNIEVHTNQSEHMVYHTDERYGDGGWRDKERLAQLLEETTQKEAAEILGCSKHTIYRWKHRHGLE